MPVLYESQKKATKKWQDKNREHIRVYKQKWRSDNEDYKVKQLGYVRAHRLRKVLGDEFSRLCSMQIF